MSIVSDKEKSLYLQGLIRKTYLTDVIERNHIQKDITKALECAKEVQAFHDKLENRLAAAA